MKIVFIGPHAMVGVSIIGHIYGNIIAGVPEKELNARALSLDLQQGNVA